MKSIKSTEAIFLASLIENQPKPKHPILGILFGQIHKLIELIDSNEVYQTKVKEILDLIKEKWNGD